MVGAAAGLEAGRFAREDAYALPVLDRVMDLPRARAVALVTGIFTLTLAIDALTPVETSFAFVYVAPIAIAAWALGRDAGMRTGVLAPFAAYATDWVNALPGPIPMWVHWTFVGHFAFFLTFAWTIAALRATYLRTKIDTMRDALTGLCNRRAFYEAVGVEVSRAQRFRRSISLAYAVAGEPAFIPVLAAALSLTRKYDVAAHLGDGQFVILMPETGAEAARAAMKRVQRALAEAAPIRIAIATSEWAPTCVDELLREADRAMASLEHRAAGEILHVVNGGMIVPARVSR